MPSVTPADRPVVEYVAAGGVVIHDGRVLLLDRPSRNEIRLPKGHVDPGETDNVAALRETTEETGYVRLTIVADLGSKIVEFDFRDRHYRRTEHYYLVRLDGQQQVERPPADVANFRPVWVELAQAPALLTYPAEQATVRDAITAYRAASTPD